jgi:hypothetical protein
VSKILPISHLAIGLRQSYIQPIGFTELVVPLSILSAWLIGLLIVVIKIFKLKE